MKGQVFKRGDTWSYRFDAGWIDGKRKRPSKGGFRTKKECETALRDALMKFEGIGYVEPKKITFSAFADEYLEYIKESGKSISTYNKYKATCKNYLNPHLGSMNIVSITPYHVENMLLSIKGVSDSTKQGIYTLLNGILNRAIKLNIIISNPCGSVERPKRKKKIKKTLNPSEIAVLYDFLDLKNPYDYIFHVGFVVAIETGLRRGELSGLLWENVDFENKRLIVENNLIYDYGKTYFQPPKTNESIRVVHVSDQIIDLLTDLMEWHKINREKEGNFYIENEWGDFVFRHFNGHYVHPMYWYNKLQKIQDKCNFDTKVTWHDLRHTFATLSLQSEVNIKALQTRLGHKDITTTMNIYGHCTPQMQDDSVNKLNQTLGHIWDTKEKH